MLTTGYRANGLHVGPGLFSPMDFCILCRNLQFLCGGPVPWTPERFHKSRMPGFSLGIRLCCPRLIRLPDVFQHTADPRFDYGKQLRFHSGIVRELIEPPT
jgi:hypothetical protein